MKRHPEALDRSSRLLGPEAMERLAQSSVLLLGLGGVGSYVAEALARVGVGRLILVDADRISPSNLNRQLPALHSTLGQMKTEVVARRLLEINPELSLDCRPVFFKSEADLPELGAVDYLVDAIDYVPAKKHLLLWAAQSGLPYLACMGTGNKFDPAQLRIGSLEKTEVCPLARLLRREARRLGISRAQVVYSTEPPLPYSEQFWPQDGPAAAESEKQGLETGARIPGLHKNCPPASLAFVPGSAGLLMASRVVSDLARGQADQHIPQLKKRRRTATD